MQTILCIIIKCVRDFGLKSNESKTEPCLFYRKDQHPTQLVVNNQLLNSKSKINVLGEAFHSKLNWPIHSENTLTKAQVIHAVKLIHKHFNKPELLNLITSN